MPEDKDKKTDSEEEVKRDEYGRKIVAENVPIIFEAVVQPHSSVEKKE